MTRRARPALPPKPSVVAALRIALEKALETMAHAALDAAKGATHEDSRAEGDKDMRATEQSYLARGQAMRTEELAEQLQRFVVTPVRAFADGEPIAPGALVAVRVDDAPRVFFVVPQGGGTELVVDGVAITVVTPASPVGAALLGRVAGEDFELGAKGAVREWEIEAVV